MALNFRTIFKGIHLKGVASNPTDNIEGSIFHNDVDSALRTYLDGAIRNIVTDTQVQILTNKQLTLPQLNEAVDLTATSTELNQLDGVTVGGNASGDILTTDDTQTLVNKTLTLPKVNDTVDLTASSTDLNQLSGISIGGSASGDVLTTDDIQTITNKTIDADLNTITNIENADIKAGADISLDKLASLTADRALQSSSTGVIEVSSVTNTELGYLSGTTSSIQTQLDDKVTGPVSSTDEAIAVYDGLTGGVIKNSLVTIDTSGNITTPGLVDGRDLSVDGADLDAHISATNAHGATGNIIGRGDSPLSGDLTGTYDTLEVASLDGVALPATPGIGQDDQFLKYDNGSNAYVLDNVALTGDVTGNNTASVVERIQGTNVPAPTSTNNRQALVYNDTTGEFEYGSTGTGGGFNLESDPYAQQGNGTWTLYDDTTQDPVDLTGGTATATFTTLPSSTAILDGAYQGVFVLEKPASDVRGNGVAKEFSIPVGVRQQGNVIVRVRVSPTAAIALGDFKLAAYDVTNSRLVPTFGLTNGDIPAVDANGTLRLTVRIPVESTTATLRLGFHVATNNTTAVNLRFSDLSVGVDSVIDVQKTLTFSARGLGGASHTSNNNYQAMSGFGVTTGSTQFWNNTTGVFTVPETGRYLVTMSFRFVDNSTGTRLGGVVLGSDPSNRVLLSPDVPVNSVHGSSLSGVIQINANDTVQFQTFQNSGGNLAYSTGNGGRQNHVSITLVESLQSALISTTEAVNQTARFIATKNNTQSIANSSTTDVVFNVVEENIGFSYNNSTGVLTILEPGIYAVSGRTSFATNTSGVRITIIRPTILSSVNGTAVSGSVSSRSDCFTVLKMEAGEGLRIAVNQNSGGSLNVDPSTGPVRFEVFRIPDFTTFGVYSEAGQVISATSNALAPATNIWPQFTGNSITLTPGRWMLFGTLSSTATAMTGTTYRNMWSVANGNNTSATPLILSTANMTGGSVISTDEVQMITNFDFTNTRSFRLPAQTVVVEVDTVQTIFLNSQITYTAAGPTLLTVRLNAVRLR